MYVKSGSFSNSANIQQNACFPSQQTDYMYAVYRLRQVKKCLQTCTECADSDHPVHAQSIILALADTGGPDQTAQTHRLVWAFSVRIFLKTHLCMT